MSKLTKAARGKKAQIEGPEGVNWELGFAYFCTGKMDLGHWNWDHKHKTAGNGKHV